ncbi:hypothetical protein [Candidatus Regiella insecticola]|uniref:Uncharacterized protein n=1 Tax=Candidatus Regiella insecticola TaxID=138073 RepID=A0A6L2ZQ49_9ENTR|nr:hypothetical protein [Candidatus Regiella insecticola]GFN46530.1 hypothetical protein RINTU1_22040 [Candidatus Regiella insecticola]
MITQCSRLVKDIQKNEEKLSNLKRSLAEFTEANNSRDKEIKEHESGFTPKNISIIDIIKDKKNGEEKITTLMTKIKMVEGNIKEKRDELKNLRNPKSITEGELGVLRTIAT